MKKKCYPERKRRILWRFFNLSGFRMIVMLLCVLSSIALAQDNAELDPSSVVLCNALVEVKHIPSPDVAYQPGVDVHGRPVVPADLPGSVQFSVPDVIEIPVTQDMAAGFGPAFEMNAALGTVKVYKDGRVFYNNQEITSQSVAYCGLKSGTNEHRQTETDVIQSKAVEKEQLPPPASEPKSELIKGGEYREEGYR